MLMHLQVASSVERPAADGEESEKANGHAEVKTKIQVFKYKKKYIIWCIKMKMYVFVSTSFTYFLSPNS